MSESCFIVPCVKNAKNEDVPSKLFEDLWRISGNYEWTEQQYKIATDEGFLSSVDPIDAVFDKNGQIDAHSFMDITGITFTSDEVKQKLSKKWEDESLPTEEVSSRVSKFNAEEELKGDFVPVILPAGAQTVKFTISQRTPNRSAALQTYLENNKLISIITNRLKQLGVAYDFVGKEKYNGRFSTENAQKAFDGLYHLIQISKGADIESTLIEESAHLATLACKDSIFINRLLSALTEDTINSLFTPEEIAAADLNTEEGKLELAGQLVAKAMKNELEGNYKGFLNRVKQAIYKIFAKTDLNSLLSEKQRARVMAETLAHGFLFDENFDVQTALKTPTTLYSAGLIPEENKLLKGTLDSIRRLGARVDNFSSVAYRDVYQKLTSKSLLEGRDLVALEEQETLAVTASAIKGLTDRLQTLGDALSGITKDIFEQDVDIDTINAIFEATELIKTLQDINETFQGYKDGEPVVEESFLNGISSLIDNINSSINAVNGNLNNYIKWYSIALLRESMGRDAIDLAADVVSPGLFSPVKIREERHINAAKLATSYIDRLSDTSSVITFFRTYSNQRDVTTQIFYDIVRKSKAKEAIQYNNEISDLTDIENEWKKFISDREVRRTIQRYGFDPDTVLYERTDDGKLTGWFVTDIRRGQFEADKRKVIREIKEQFRQELEAGTLTTSDGSYTFDMASYKRLSKAQRYNVFQDYRDNHELLDKFYDEAYFDRQSRIFSKKYENSDFINLCKELPEFRELYDKILEFKTHIDADYLTDQTSNNTGGLCHGVAGRIPQFKASFINKIKNKKQIRKDLSDTSDLATYCEDVTSDNFGSPVTEPVALLKEEEDDIEIDKLALYGINLLENMEDLSTDLFKSLDKYVEMACRFNTSQEVATRLELFNTQLERRYAEAKLNNTGKAENAARISSQQRRNIMKRLIYRTNKSIKNFNDESWWGRFLNRVTNIKAVAGALSAFGAIRALCISPIAGLKNYIAGMRVFMQDVSSGVVEGVTLKDVIKQTFLNLNPKHIGGEIARIVSGGTLGFDQYQKLVDRWDSYRTPAKITRRKGFLSLQTLVNVAMANYSLTDNALIGIIYNSMLGAKRVYDAEAGKMISATDIYGFDKNGNPYIRNGILKDAREATRYELLKAAREDLERIIENNSLAEEDINIEMMRLQDSEAIRKLEDFYNNNGESLNIYNPSGGYKTAEEVDAVFKDIIRGISFNEDDEYKLCNGINDYIISSQGVYGMLNATEFQSSIYTQSLGKIKGYMFGYIQRNYYSNYSVSAGEYKHAMLDSYRLALWSVFSNKNLVQYDDISRGKYAGYTLALITLPFAIKNKNLREHMTRCGWDPDQLKKVASMCLGFWINFLLAVLSRSLYRGNEQRVGQKVYEKKGKLPLKTSITGLSLMYPRLLGGENKLVKPGILAPKRAISVDQVKANEQLANWSKPSRKVQYPKNINDYSYGAFIPGTQEFNDRVASYQLKNTIYDTKDPLYYMTGMFYRLARGVRDEGLTLMDPIRFANDLIQMGDYSSSIMFSSGLKTAWDGISALTSSGERWEKWRDKEYKFWLTKLGFTYDSTPEPGMEKVQPIDWYGKQESIDRYQKQQQGIPTISR